MVRETSPSRPLPATSFSPAASASTPTTRRRRLLQAANSFDCGHGQRHHQFRHDIHRRRWPAGRNSGGIQGRHDQHGEFHGVRQRDRRQFCDHQRRRRRRHPGLQLRPRQRHGQRSCRHDRRPRYVRYLCFELNGTGNVSSRRTSGLPSNLARSGILAVNHATAIRCGSIDRQCDDRFRRYDQFRRASLAGGAQPSGVSAGYFAATGLRIPNINGVVFVDNAPILRPAAGTGHRRTTISAMAAFDSDRRSRHARVGRAVWDCGCSNRFQARHASGT